MNNLEKMRAEFERLPLIVAVINDNFKYIDHLNEYTHDDHTNNRMSLSLINGAWYTFQEQQKKIDALDNDLAHWKQSYWKQSERLAEYDSIFMSNNEDLEVLCFKKEKEIERLKIELEKALKGGK